MTRPTIMIQARAGSTRLPGKVLAAICGRSALAWVVERCRQSRLSGSVVLLTSDLDRDDAVAAAGAASGALIYRGSENDVLLRFVNAARLFQCPVLVRVTADCPFVDPAIIDQVIELYEKRPADYVCVRNYPEGVGSVELVRLSALETALARTTSMDTRYREHVITYLIDNPSVFDLFMPEAMTPLRRPDLRFSIDTAEDLVRARRLAEFFHPSLDFHAADILSWHDEHRRVC